MNFESRQEIPLGIKIELEDESSHWAYALKKPKHVQWQSDLTKIYGQAVTGGEPIVEFEKNEHPSLPGFSRIGLNPFTLASLPIRRDLAYRCGYERTIVAGRPEIKDSEKRPGCIDFNCVMCKNTMYSERVQPNRARGFMAPGSKHNSNALNLEED